MKTIRKLSSITFYGLLVASSLKSCTVSMNEPFYQVTFNEIIWQYIMPASTLSLAGACIYMKTLAVVEGKAQGKELAIIIAVLILPILLSAEAIYGYSYDLSHFAGVQ
jgi:hypothetical protein